MKVLVKNEELCIDCGLCEQSCSNAFFKVKDREKAALRVESKGGKVKIITCTQCGKCIDVCPVEAIYRDKRGIVRIDKDRCVGCFICVGFCPEGAMMQHDDNLEPFKCSSCGICAKECPTGAIIIEEKED